MDVIKTLAAGKPGTQRYVRQYGDRLLCVRHRHGNGRRITTIELIVDERPDGVIYRRDPAQRPEIPRDVPDMPKPIAVRVGVQEMALRDTVKQNGGRWDPNMKVWWLTPDAVRRLGLQDRVTDVWMCTKAATCSCQLRNRRWIVAGGRTAQEKAQTCGGLDRDSSGRAAG